jgi:hypothetical protein
LSRHRRSHRGAQEFSLGVCNEGYVSNQHSRHLIFDLSSVPGQPAVGSHLESHSSEYWGLVYRSRVDELGDVAAQHAADQASNQPDLWDFQPRSNTQAVSNHRHPEAESYSSAQSGINAISYEPVLADASRSPPSAQYFNTPSRESLGRFAVAEYVQRDTTFDAFDLPYAIPIQDLSGQGHSTGRLNSSTMTLNPSPWLRQAEQSNQYSAVSADMPNTFRQADGAQPFFNSPTNINSPSSHTAKREIADWEDDTSNVGSFHSSQVSLLHKFLTMKRKLVVSMIWA